MRALPLAALGLLALVSRACGGPAFFVAEGTGGTGPGPGGACRSPADCDDGDPCTIDDCGPNGACVSNWKCVGELKCCNGTCGECCSDAECDDEVTCTTDACIAGFCSSAPGACNVGEYCSIPRRGCVPLESCGTGQSCDDGDACTTDSCDGTFCVHEFCPSGGKCCDGRPDLGCNACCANGECDDGDLCTVDLCTAQGCTHEPQACPSGTACCASTGQCAECCSETECDDGIDCTADSCVGGLCRHSPDHEACDPGQVCVGGVDGGCQTPAECVVAADCPASNPCETFDCVESTCRSSLIACPEGTLCCADAPEGTNPCQACCSASDCDGPSCAQPDCVDGTCTATPDDTLCADAAGVGQQLRCDPDLGCIECTVAADCGTHPCFEFECRNYECFAGPPRECASADGVVCQDCCETADCPPSADGAQQSCCHGRCCAGGCSATGECPNAPAGL